MNRLESFRRDMLYLGGMPPEESEKQINEGTVVADERLKDYLVTWNVSTWLNETYFDELIREAHGTIHRLWGIVCELRFLIYFNGDKTDDVIRNNIATASKHA